MRPKAARLRPEARARRLPISVWQSHSWKKDILKPRQHLRTKSPLKPVTKRTNIMQNIKRLELGNRLLQWSLYGLAGCAFSWSPLAMAAVANISIVNFAFTPSSVNIHVNDSVKWTWAGSPHSTTSDTGLWESRPPDIDPRVPVIS